MLASSSAVCSKNESEEVLKIHATKPIDAAVRIVIYVLLDMLAHLCKEYESRRLEFHHVRKAKSLNVASQVAPFQPGSDWRLTRTVTQAVWTSASRQS